MSMVGQLEVVAVAYDRNDAEGRYQRVTLKNRNYMVQGSGVRPHVESMTLILPPDRPVQLGAVLPVDCAHLPYWRPDRDE